MHRFFLYNLKKILPSFFEAYLWKTLKIADSNVWDIENARNCYERYLVNDKKIRMIDKIGFMIPNITIMHHFFPIIRNLSKKFYYCIPVNSSKQETDQIISFLKQEDLSFTTVRSLITSYTRIRVLVSNAVPIGFSPVPNFSDLDIGLLLKYLGHCQVRMMYAGGKIGWNLSDWNSLYDYIFVYGPFYEKIFNEKFPRAFTVQVGYPRLDDYFAEKEKKIFYCKRFGLDLGKKNLCLLPTHGDLSYLEEFKKILPHLKDYNIIIKTHPFSLLDKSNFPYSNVFIIPPEENNIPCMIVADFIICNGGGSIFSALYCDKKILIHQPNDNGTFASSSEDLVCKYIKPFKWADLLDILRSENYWDEQIIARKELREIFFKFNVNSGKNAALKLLDILENS